MSVSGPGLTILGGKNGAGKSTLIQAICGILPPAHGKVKIDGNDIATVGGRRRARALAAYLPQQPTCPRSFTVGDLLAYGTWLQRVPPRERQTRMEKAIEFAGLTTLVAKRVARLSGGEQRRAFLASVLVGGAPLLLLDEPTVGLDGAQRLAIRALLRDVAKERTILASSHLAEDFEHLADRILLLKGGSVIFDASSEEFMRAGAIGTRPISGAEAAFTALLGEDVP